jgi:hypothetical protein
MNTYKGYAYSKKLYDHNFFLLTSNHIPKIVVICGGIEPQFLKEFC